MPDLPPRVVEDIDTLAKWAAKQPSAAKAGGEIAYLLAKVAEIRRDGTPEQIAQVREALDAFRSRTGTFEPAWLNRKLDEISGHTGVNL